LGDGVVHVLVGEHLLHVVHLLERVVQLEERPGDLHGGHRHGVHGDVGYFTFLVLRAASSKAW
jgi:hypothetical protein